MVFVISVSAQTPSAKNFFDVGTKKAGTLQYVEALENYRNALRFAQIEKPNDNFLVRIHFNIGVCLFKLKQTEKAVEEFSKSAVLSGEKYQKAFYALGMAEAELKNWDESEAAFLHALLVNEKDGEAWFDLALVYLRKQEFEKAETSFRNSIKFNSIAAADAHNNLGVIFALRHEFRTAEREFEKAFDISNGKSTLAENNLQFCRRLGQNKNFDLTAQLMFTQF